METSMRIPCTKCGVEILATTAKANGGLCGPCARGGGFCTVCGKRVWEPTPAGEYIHMNCAWERRDDEIAKTSGITWSRVEEIDWDILRDGLHAAIQRCCLRVAAANAGRSATDVVLAYRTEVGIRLEPCVTFSDGMYVNAALNDDAFLNELEPFDRAIIRITKDLEENDAEEALQQLISRIQSLMPQIFKSLRQSGFGLPLAPDCTVSLNEF